MNGTHRQTKSSISICLHSTRKARVDQIDFLGQLLVSDSLRLMTCLPSRFLLAFPSVPNDDAVRDNVRPPIPRR
jgi:hypothetical protein